MANIIEDISFLTNVSEAVLKKLVTATSYAIGHAIHEGVREQQEIIILDIGIGELQVKIQNDLIKYKFVPDKSLENMIVRTVTTNTSPIAIQLDNNLKEKIDKAYKDILI